MTWRNRDSEENEINRIIEEEEEEEEEKITPQVKKEDTERRSTGVIVREI